MTTKNKQAVSEPNWKVPAFLEASEAAELEEKFAKKTIDFYGVTVDLDPSVLVDRDFMEGDASELPLTAMLPLLVPDENQQEQLLAMCHDGTRVNQVYVGKLVEKLIARSQEK